MNSLEFIDLEIARAKSKYKEHIKFGQTAFAIKDEKRLQTLYQIKSQLEAWEVVKNKLNLKVQTEEAVTEGFCMKGYWLLVEQFPYTQTTILEQEEYDILKKALEVDNSVQWVEYTLKDFKRDNLV